MTKGKGANLLASSSTFLSWKETKYPGARSDSSTTLDVTGAHFIPSFIHYSLISTRKRLTGLPTLCVYVCVYVHGLCGCFGHPSINALAIHPP